MVEKITSLDDQRLDVYARLTEVQLRNKLEPEKGIFIAESRLKVMLHKNIDKKLWKT